MALNEWAFAIPEDVAAFEFVMSVEGETELPALLDAVLTTGAPHAGSDNVYVRLIAGDAAFTGHADSSGPGALFNDPYHTAASEDGTIFVSDSGNRSIRMVLPDGSVHTIAGDRSRYGSPTSTTGDLVSFRAVRGIDVNPDSTVVYVADSSSHVIARLSLINSWADRTDPSNWQVRVIAGTGTSGYTDGDGTVAQFSSPTGLVVTEDDSHLFVTETGNQSVRRLRLAGSNPDNPLHWDVSLAAGHGGAGHTDAFGGSARFYVPVGIAEGPDGNLYIADQDNRRVRRMTPAGMVTTVAGDGTSGHVDSASGSTARFQELYEIACDSSGYIYVTDWSNDSLRRISPTTGETRTVADAGSAPYEDGPGSSAYFNSIYGVTVNKSGDVYVTTNKALFRISRIIDDAAR
jgi:sugar lactone lactonase YvrE